MFNLLFTDPLAFIISAAGLLIAITIHEFAHAWAADKLGDPTPRLQDRLTLNPKAHLDPLGTIAILFIGFGWGKPVMFDPYNLENPKRDSALIALAGPASNLLLALGISLLIRFGGPLLPNVIQLGQLLYFTLYINVMLAIFNLVPVHPLDGGKILIGLLPRDLAIEVDDFLRRYGMYVLLFMILPLGPGGSSPVSSLIRPVINIVMTLLLSFP